jgi:hypothetical protein
MPGDQDGAICAINLLSLRPGVAVEDFRRFSSELDQPICLAQDVVQGFDAYAITSRRPGAPEFDVVEVMTVRSWREWERVRDGLDALKPVTEAFNELVASDTVRTVFATPILPQG